MQPSGSATKKEKSEIKDAGVEGVVHRTFESRVSVAINPASDESAAVDRVLTSGRRLWMVKLANEVTFNRMEKTMGHLKGVGEAAGEGAASPLIDVLFGRSRPASLEAGYEKAELKWFDEGLNDSQKEAVRFALASKEVGTGPVQFFAHSRPPVLTPWSSADSRPSRHWKDPDSAGADSAARHSAGIP